MKKAFLIIIISYLMVVFSFGQDSYIKNRWTIKTGYSRYNTNKSANNKVITTGNYRIEANYGILNFVEAGIYFGYSKFESFRINYADSTIIHRNSPTPFYGINCNLSILPLFIKEKDFRFDLYLSGKFGGLLFAAPKDFFPSGHSTEYGIGAGLSFYLWKHLGLFSEYSYGNYYFKDNQNFRYGLTFKF